MVTVKISVLLNIRSIISGLKVSEKMLFFQTNFDSIMSAGYELQVVTFYCQN